MERLSTEKLYEYFKPLKDVGVSKVQVFRNPNDIGEYSILKVALSMNKEIISVGIILISIEKEIAEFRRSCMPQWSPVLKKLGEILLSINWHSVGGIDQIFNLDIQ